MRTPLIVAGFMGLIAIAVASTEFVLDPSQIVTERVLAFSQGLDEIQQPKFMLAFDDDARLGFSFLPGDHKGLTLGEMTVDQRAQAREIYQAALSATGVRKLEGIEALEDVLRVLEPGNEAVRDRKKYAIAVFGAPGTAAPWGLRWEGHHLSLNWTIAGGKIISSTPQFLGANPAEVREGPQAGTRVLSVEEDLGRSLVKSLDEKQRAACVISDTAPADIITRLERQATIQEDKGIAYNDLTPEQQGVLLTLIHEYANVQAPALALARLESLKAAGLDKLKFAWMGGLDKGEGHYYRIQGTTFIIEYDNTQNNANHIHTAWRDFTNDFGRDVLLEHYKAKHN